MSSVSGFRGIVALVLLSALGAGCGFEAPHPGSLTVTSEPAGASISIDGNATGQITPYMFTGLDGDTAYEIVVALDGWQPARRTVTIAYGSAASAAFNLAAAYGSLQVTSAPAGAAIALDGAATGEVTPHTFDELLPGDYVVTVSLADHLSDPEAITVTVEANALATATFDLVLLYVPRIVLIEGFSNVYCSNCPTMGSNVEYALAQPGFGPDRALYVKWPAAFVPFDPFYWVTQSLTNARVAWYFGSPGISLPSLTVDGEVRISLGSPPEAAGLMNYIAAQPAVAYVEITVTTDEDLGDVSDLDHVAQVAVRSPGGLDLTGHRLDVVLVYETVTTQNTGYQGGVTEFHWVVRDHAQLSSDLGQLAAGTIYEFTIELADPHGGEPANHAVYPESKQIVAWIQNAETKLVVQAGSTLTTARAHMAADHSKTESAPLAPTGAE